MERGEGPVNLHLDTHVAIWLAAGEKRRLRPVQARLRGGSLRISPVVVVEMEILREIGRIHGPVTEVLDVLLEDYGVERAAGDMGEISDRARPLGWTRDPFDRFIVAHAIASNATLITADETIRKHFPDASWG